MAEPIILFNLFMNLLERCVSYSTETFYIVPHCFDSDSDYNLLSWFKSLQDPKGYLVWTLDVPLKEGFIIFGPWLVQMQQYVVPFLET